MILGMLQSERDGVTMFDIEKAKAKGLDSKTIEMFEKINDNTRKRESCKLHEFEMIRLGKYKCKNCDCIEDGGFVSAYKQGLEHGKISI